MMVMEGESGILTDHGLDALREERSEVSGPVESQPWVRKGGAVSRHIIPTHQIRLHGE
jgi:hypothetical protein